MQQILHYKRFRWRHVFLLIVVSLAAASTLRAQSPREIRPLTIGDTVPDIVFQHMLNYKDSTARLSDFRGKLVILDFWNTWCGACIDAFPKMGALQKQFKDDIQIILVNTGGPKYDGKKRVINTLAKLKERTGFYANMPVSILDTSLNQYFPHKSVPHEVWISKEGEVIAITSAEEVSGRNITSLLAGEDPGMEVKNEWTFNGDKPVWQQGDGLEPSHFIYRSVFTPYIRNLGKHGGRRYNSDHEVTGLYNTNKPLISYIRSAYHKELDSCSHRMILNVKDPERYEYGYKGSQYCYDLQIPPVKEDLFHFEPYLKTDLARGFQITGKIVTRATKCYVMTGTNSNIKDSYTKYEKKEGDLRESTIKKYLHHWPVSGIVDTFSPHLDMPLINESGIENEFLDVTFPDHFTWSENSDNVLQLIKDLGFRIRIQERQLKVLVISDRYVSPESSSLYSQL